MHFMQPFTAPSGWHSRSARSESTLGKPCYSRAGVARCVHTPAGEVDDRVIMALVGVKGLVVLDAS